MVLYGSNKCICITQGSNFKTQKGFYCLNCLHSFPTEIKCDSHEYVKIVASSKISLPSEENNPFKHRQGK